MNASRLLNKENGQTLVTLLFFMVMSITITTAAVIMIMTNSLSGDRVVEGTNAYYEAESGAENAMMELLRNPGYKGEDNLVVGDGKASVVIFNNPDGSLTVTSIATSSASFSRKVQVVAAFVNNALTVSSWKEVF